MRLRFSMTGSFVIICTIGQVTYSSTTTPKSQQYISHLRTRFLRKLIWGTVGIAFHLIGTSSCKCTFLCTTCTVMYSYVCIHTTMYVYSHTFMFTHFKVSLMNKLCVISEHELNILSWFQIFSRCFKQYMWLALGHRRGRVDSNADSRSLVNSQFWLIHIKTMFDTKI
jgi:hypothetical protein